MFSERQLQEATDLLAACRRRSLRLATAESCTGGLVSALLTEIPGSSEVLDRGFVTYSNDAKIAMLGVPAAAIETHGAVSTEVALAMAEGAIAHSAADVAVAITGVAGPAGGSAAKPVGLVHFACARRGAATKTEARRFGDVGRGAIRMAAVDAALQMLHVAVRA